MDPILLKAAISMTEHCYVTQEIDNQITVEIEPRFETSNQIDFWEKIALDPPLCNNDRANVSVTLAKGFAVVEQMNESSNKKRFMVVANEYFTFTNVYLHSPLNMISEKKYVVALVALPTGDNFEELLEKCKSCSIEIENADFKPVDPDSLPIKLLIPVKHIKTVTFLDC
ncbi:MAG: hypothetical protein WCO58_01065 [bacterium]